MGASPYSRVLVSFATDPPPQTSLTWRVEVEKMTMADEYDHWVKNRTPPLFGKYPDAKIFELARWPGRTGSGADPRYRARALGANTLPLARAGYPTDAVELAPSLAAILRADAEKEGLPVKVFEGNMFDPSLGIARGRYRILLLAEVVAVALSLRGRAARAVQSRGALAAEGRPAAVQRVPRQRWLPARRSRARDVPGVLGNLFTRRELQDAVEDEPLEQVSDESAQAYEKANLPAAECHPPVGSRLGRAGAICSICLPANPRLSCAG